MPRRAEGSTGKRAFNSHRLHYLKRELTSIAIGLGLAGLGFLESLRQRGRAIEAEQAIRLYQLMAQLPDGEWEICPACYGEADACFRCFDQGFISHEHVEED